MSKNQGLQNSQVQLFSLILLGSFCRFGSILSFSRILPYSKCASFFGRPPSVSSLGHLPFCCVKSPLQLADTSPHRSYRGGSLAGASGCSFGACFQSCKLIRSFHCFVVNCDTVSYQRYVVDNDPASEGKFINEDLAVNTGDYKYVCQIGGPSQKAWNDLDMGFFLNTT